jgi:biopolymer transport protein ExbD
MIPLIDISLVLLIFFMMTTTVAAISRIKVAEMENADKLDSNPELIRIDIDWVDKKAIYGIGLGNNAPAEGDGDLNDPAELLKKLDSLLASRTQSAKIRIAGHGDVPYERIDKILAELQKRIDAGVRISNIAFEVNDRR